MGPSPSEHSNNSAAISVWWDLENCPVPYKAPSHKAMMRIRTLLTSSGFVGPAVVHAYCDANQLPNRVGEGLARTGVIIHHVPNGRKDACDKALLVDMFNWAMDNPPPGVIFLISGDQDYAHAIHSLAMRNYSVLLATPPETSHYLLDSAAEKVFKFREILLLEEDEVEAEIRAKRRSKKGKKPSYGFAGAAESTSVADSGSDGDSLNLVQFPESPQEAKFSGLNSDLFETFIEFVKSREKGDDLRSIESSLQKLSSSQILSYLQTAIVQKKIFVDPDSLSLPGIDPQSPFEKLFSFFSSPNTAQQLRRRFSLTAASDEAMADPSQSESDSSPLLEERVGASEPQWRSEEPEYASDDEEFEPGSPPEHGIELHSATVNGSVHMRPGIVEFANGRGGFGQFRGLRVSRPFFRSGVQLPVCSTVKIGARFRIGLSFALL